MTRAFTPVVVTGNALLEGDVVYLAPGGHWTRHLARAELIADPQLAEQRLAQAARRPGEVVGPYLAEVRPGPGGPEALHFREAFRAIGPSNYPHGKQEQDRGNANV